MDYRPYLIDRRCRKTFSTYVRLVFEFDRDSWSRRKSSSNIILVSQLNRIWLGTIVIVCQHYKKRIKTNVVSRMISIYLENEVEQYRVLFSISPFHSSFDNLSGVCKRGCEVFNNRRIIVSNLFCEYLCTSFIAKYLTYVPHFYQKALTDTAEIFFLSISDNLGCLLFSVFQNIV